MNDLTILYYTANEIPDYFMENTQKHLLSAIGDTPIISVSFKPMNFGTNICVGSKNRSVYKMYWQVLLAARAAKTKYVACAEDDMLYSPTHFHYRPADDVFAYDLNKWSIFSWTRPPIFSYRPRKLMNSLIVTRDALVRTLEERYSKYPDASKVPDNIMKFYWGEPGRFEDHLGITKLKTEEYNSEIPNVMFSTEEALGYLSLGKRKAHSDIQRKEITYWGKAESILKLYA